MSNFQIHQLSSGAISRNSNIIHDTEVNGVYGTRKDLAGSVADLNNIQIANEYDDTLTYSYGDYTIKNGVLYRNIVAITSPEAWTPAHWTAVMVTGEYKRVRIMTKAQFDLLSNDEKDGFIYVSDYPTKIQDIDNVNLNTSDNNKLLGVSVIDGVISVGAVELIKRGTATLNSPRITINSENGTYYRIGDIIKYHSVINFGTNGQALGLYFAGFNLDGISLQSVKVFGYMVVDSDIYELSTANNESIWVNKAGSRINADVINGKTAYINLIATA